MRVIIFACIEKNIGDDLFISTVCNRYPWIDFYISSDAEYLSTNNIPNLYYDNNIALYLRYCEASSKSNIKKLVKKILSWYYRKRIGHYRIGVYIVGNAFKNINYSSSNQIQWLKERTKLVDKFYLLSTNFGPYNDKRWIDDCKAVFSSIEDICFRDIDSYNLFKDMKNVRYAPDAVLSLKTKRLEQELLNKNLIISVIDCGLSIRGDWLKEKQLQYEKKMQEIICEFISNGYEITLLNSNTVQDENASKRIIKDFDCDKISIKNYEGNIHEILELYQNSSFVIGTRLHTIILAWLFNIPVFPVIYDIKVSSLLSSYKYEGDYVEIENIDVLNVSRIKKELYEQKNNLEKIIFEKANQQFSKLDEELKNENS